ncbi:MAG TPA: CTP synthase [Tepidisphaeraceae bacterium]
MTVRPPISIALIGDYDGQVPAHRAIPIALDLAARDLGLEFRYDWLHTTKLDSSPQSALGGYQGIWCVPASPYANTDGAIAAIRFAREQRRAFLGTCGGFQHALLEFAQNVLGMADPRHAEMNPEALDPLVAPLACPLVEASGTISLSPQSRIARAYCSTEIVAEYHCRFGLSRKYEALFARSALRPVGWDAQGEIRAVELNGHPFFVATLFQHERAALRQEVPPLVREFVKAIGDDCGE